MTHRLVKLEGHDYRELRRLLNAKLQAAKIQLESNTKIVNDKWHEPATEPVRRRSLRLKAAIHVEAAARRIPQIERWLAAMDEAEKATE